MSEQMAGVRSRRASILRRLALVGAGLAVTVAALALAWRSREMAINPAPLALPELPRLIFDPYPLGFVFQAIVVPAGLIYLLSQTGLFRRALTGEARPGDRRKLFGALLLIQVLVLCAELGRSAFVHEPPTAVLGLLVVVTGALLGGWRMSLGLGLVVMALHGSQLFVEHQAAAVLRDLRVAYRLDGLHGMLMEREWGQVFLGHYVFNLWASAAVWAGAVAGVAVTLLGRRLFSPPAAMALGTGIDLGAGALTALAGIPPGTWLLVPSSVVSGLALAAVALMIRNVQADAIRRRAEAAELGRTQAELRALRAQINPHFLFNSLNTIRYFVRTDPETARRLLIDLSEVFQRALRSGDMVPLRGELGYVEAYLSLEKARLGDRLQVQWAVSEEVPADQPMPTLILQPVVENAVIHGIAKKPEGGVICITAAVEGRALVLQVEDDGLGMAPERLAEVLAPGVEDRQSIGLYNVDRRLQALYGPAHGLAVETRAGAGTRVRLRIPLDRAAGRKRRGTCAF